ncbi:MAG: hypothetical protein ACSLFK_09095 [Gemmatimonadaceae bacterium]
MSHTHRILKLMATALVAVATPLVAQMDSAVKMPGVANAWTMPIKGRIDMLERLSS